MDKLNNTPNMEWLQLTSKQTRVLLCAWSADTIICKGRELNTAHRLARRGLLHFVGPIDGGLRGEFELTDDALAYPPSGLKALIVRREGSYVVQSEVSP